MQFPTLTALLDFNEGEHCEFKEAREKFDPDELANYLCALSNNGGGFIALGITDKRPRQVVGSLAFPQPEATRRTLIEKLKINIDFLVLQHDGKRVLVFGAASRPIGLFVQSNNVAWTRRGDSLVGMTPEEQRRIYHESGHDFSADICAGASLEDLDQGAVELFRKRWIMSSDNKRLDAVTSEQVLRDCEAVTPEGITFAALILFGKHESLGRLLGNCEVVFEYRSTNASGKAQHRENFRQGLFAFFDRLWELVNMRNDMQHYQDGFFIVDVPTFDERSVREAILNAVSHRNYQLPGSVFIRQYPDRLVVESPGGFPVGVTQENILNCQSPRNRRLADILLRGGLVERSGQGMNLMFERSIRLSKALPSFMGSDDYQIRLTLDGVMNDPHLLVFMNKVGEETLEGFSTEDFLLVDAVHKGEKIKPEWQPHVERLIDLGVLERIGRGKFMLGRKFYTISKTKGKYTRLRGLDRETNKQLLLKHIRDNKETGSTHQEFEQILPSFTRRQIQRYVNELREQGLIEPQGLTRGIKWYPQGQ